MVTKGIGKTCEYCGNRIGGGKPKKSKMGFWYHKSCYDILKNNDPYFGG